MRGSSVPCPACQRDNPPEARFCLECGAALAHSCVHCGQALPGGAKFCMSCGTSVGREKVPDSDPISPGENRGQSQGEGHSPFSPSLRSVRSYTPRHLAEKILTSRSAVEGERKHVTVRFADVANYTSLAERADPEEMHALMDRCFNLILEQIHHFDGTVNQFTGDGVMALFGAPIALEDAPQRAVRAALGIQKGLEPLSEEVQARHGLEFRMRIGINTGSVVVGKIGDDLRMDYTAVGDTTNLAARLQQIARPGAVLVSAPTRKLVEGYFDLHPLRPVKVKGKSQPVRAFEVRGERAVSGRIEAIAGSGLTPYVGREREIDALAEAFESARGAAARWSSSWAMREWASRA